MKTYSLHKDKSRASDPAQTISVPEEMPWGKYKGVRFDRMTDENYLMWLADDPDRMASVGQRKYPPVPLQLRVAAREELKRRGYRKFGSRWSKEDY
jgi:hypothetical protein